jgi:Cu/Ag efflux pump CusA
MERYYTRTMEVGLATTPGVDNIRSTSFYGLSFVRVTFRYGIDSVASGPFVMSTQDDIARAFADYRSGAMGRLGRSIYGPDQRPLAPE